MGAGSLSDARTVALLTEHFIPVIVSELATAELIESAADRELMQQLDQRLRADGRSGLDAGQRELVLSPDGAILGFWSSLRSGKLGNQYAVSGREDPDGVVHRVFAHLRSAREAVDAGLPADWDRIIAGTAPSVAVARVTPIPPLPLRPGAQGLRIQVRNSHLAYDTLTGGSIVELSSAEIATILPSPEAGAQCQWPRTFIDELGRAWVPRGMVIPNLAEDSIEGEVLARVDDDELQEVTDELHGTLQGRIRLLPASRGEGGRRANAACRFRSSLRVVGEFTLDAETGRLRTLRIGAESEDMKWLPPLQLEQGPQAHMATAEFVSR